MAVPLKITTPVHLTIKEWISVMKWTHLKKLSKKSVLPDLNMSAEAGIDQILAKFLKDASDVLAHPLSRIINLVNLLHFEKNVKLLSKNDKKPKQCKWLTLQIPVKF